MDWPTAAVAATVGGGVVVVVKQFFEKKGANNPDSTIESFLVQSLQQDCQERRDLLKQLVSSNNDTALILKEISLLNKHRETRTEELHRTTHKALEYTGEKLDKITSNQESIEKAIVKGFTQLAKAGV
jgi:hypothetical protein